MFHSSNLTDGSNPTPGGMPLHEVMATMRKTLEPKFGPGETRAIIRLIFHYLKGWNATDLVINEGRPISENIRSRIDEIIERLLKDEPIQYIVGNAYFYGMDFHVEPGVLIPRPETEELVDLIVKENSKEDLNVLDACTGSGCIAISLARNLPFSNVTAIDNSEKALEIARQNARNLKAKIEFVKGDIFNYNPTPGHFDIIVSNPPYICESEKNGMEPNVLDYEPHEALFVPDSDPLLFYKCLAGIGRSALAPGGRIYFEINPLHADSLVKLMKDNGYDNVTLHRDIHGKQRMLSASINS